MSLSALELRGIGALARDFLQSKVTRSTSYASYDVPVGQGDSIDVDGVPLTIVLKEYTAGDQNLRAVVKYGDTHVMLTGYTSDREDSWGQGYEGDAWDGAPVEVEYREITVMDWAPVRE